MATNTPTDAMGATAMLTFDDEAGRKMEAIYRSDDAAARRKALRDALNLQPGEHGLYIGSGPGFAPCEIARALGLNGRLSMLEKNDAMLAMIRRRAESEGLLARLDLRQGDAASLPFPDGAFAFVGSAQVFEYVPDISQAILETYRVLRPGGRVALIDSDWQTLIWHAEDSARRADREGLGGSSRPQSPSASAQTAARRGGLRR